MQTEGGAVYLENQAVASKDWMTPHGLSGQNGPDGNEFSTMVRDWQTPNGQMHTSRKQVGADEREPLLPNQSRDWATPVSRDHKGAGLPREDKSGASLAMQTEGGESSPQGQVTQLGNSSSSNTRTSPRRLNPVFVCWLMAMPHCWWTRAEPISFGAAATQLWRRKVRSLLSSYFNES